MERQKDYEIFRTKYPVFRYRSFNYKEDNENIIINYNYSIDNLTTFNHEISILKEDIDYDIRELDNYVFNLGVLELVSYWKSTCSPNVIIECGYLNEEQIGFFKKTFFNGLGEMFYTNGIHNTLDNFMNITCTGNIISKSSIKKEYNNYIIPVGGGKDSCVTLELLHSKDNYAMIVNPKTVTLECAKAASVKIIKIKRVIDKNLIELNKENYLNGHTPFSAMISFLSVMLAYMTNKKYIALSNESSANESNVDGTNINHQYSKSLEYENDFRYYAENYLNNEIEYFSFLRPILEVEIGYLFSKLDKYHNIFKSCNVGSKENPWIWCGNCSKCLFVYTILSPFLYKDKLVSIFKEDLFEKKELETTFVELLGYGKNKPFDCVGTYEEVRYALNTIISKLDELPYLLQLYKDKYYTETDNLLNFYTDKNNLTKEQSDILKGALYERKHN